jgi:hypothetical protein
MNHVRRTVVTLIGGLVLLVPATSASAAVKDTASVRTTGITTVDVAAPGHVSTTGTRCVSAWNNGTWATRLDAQVSWTASPTPGVSGYLITAVFSDGTRYPVLQTGASATSASGSYDAYYATQNIRVTVTALTSYGWTEESAQSGVIKC